MINHRHLVVVLVVCLLFMPCCEGAFTVNISRTLETIPQNEQKMIEDFFRFHMQFWDPFGYTLFGRKPMSISSHIFNKQFANLYSQLNFIFFASPQICYIDRCYEVWNKHKDKFPSDKFLLKEICFKSKGNFLLKNQFHKELCLINKKELMDACLKNKELFGVDFSCEKINELRESIHITGIQEKLAVLLGYGRENGKLFQEVASKGIKNINRNICFFNSPEGYEPLFDYCSLPAFLADIDSEETKELYFEYQKTQKKMTKILSEDKFLEVVLSKFCEK